MTQHKDGSKRTTGIRSWLFNPFQHLSLPLIFIVGFVGILIAGFFASVSDYHFDGVLDFHYTRRNIPLSVFVAEGYIAWLSMAFAVSVATILLAKEQVTWFNIVANQALARFPTAIIALFSLFPGFKKYTTFLISQVEKTQIRIETNSADAIVFFIITAVMIPMMVWTVFLMYRGFSLPLKEVSRGKKIGFFIGALLAGEILSKVIIITLLKATV